MLSLALTSIGTGLLLAGIVMWLKGRGNPEARHIGDGFAAAGFGIYFVADVLSGVTISASIPGLFALWLGYQWWKDRRRWSGRNAGRWS